MFRENSEHAQFDFFDPFQLMGTKMRQRLEASWAGTFYREIFCRIEESPFAVFTRTNHRGPTRPSTPGRGRDPQGRFWLVG